MATPICFQRLPFVTNVATGAARTEIWNYGNSPELIGPNELTSLTGAPAGYTGPTGATFFTVASGPVAFLFDTSGALRAGQVGATGWLAPNRGVASVGFGFGNSVSGDYSSALGGVGNSVSGDESVIGGGVNNHITEDGCVIGGGYQNQTTGLNSAVLGGAQNAAVEVLSGVLAGQQNKASGRAAAVVAGHNNTSSGESSVVAGGNTNVSSGINAVVGGGSGCKAEGANSFAHGVNAVATGAGSFAIGEHIQAGEGTFAARYPAGYNFATANGSFIVDANGLASLSADREHATNLYTLSPLDVLTKLVQVPIYRYNPGNTSHFYRGPMAQDWHVIFPSGEKDRKRIDLTDLHGISIAAIQGLFQKVKDLEQQVDLLKTQLVTV